MTIQITIANTTYDVVKMYTPETAKQEGMAALSAHMTENNLSAHLFVRKPKGQVVFLVFQDTKGRFSPLTRLGRW